jgi:hypothetical protein
MVFTGPTPRLTIDNSLSGLCDVFYEHANLEVIPNQMIIKMQLIASVHKFLFENVEHVQRKQKKVYVARKGLQTFEGFIKNIKIKMHRPRKKRYIFVDYKDSKGFQEQDHGNIICIFKNLKW